jgi:uncharacterized repeat protein (TIGR03943 family)
MPELPHVHEHTHAGPGHHHHHDHGHEDDSYVVDQLCMVGLSGGFGAICLCLFLWKSSMLNLLLGPQFHLFVLLSGIALVFLALVRGASLWAQAGAHSAEHVHAEGECCDHEHADHDHHHHHHDHAAEDHDHGWAPWRYVVLLVPIILFMLGLPNKGPEVNAIEVKIDFTKEAANYARVLAAGPAPLAMLGMVSALHQDEPEGEVTALDFKSLEGAAATPSQREFFKNKMIEVRGQYSPSPGSSRVFSLVRFRIQCCAADSIPLDVPIVCREEIRGVARGNWVKVTGKVDFLERNGRFSTVVMVPSRTKVEACTPDLNPWLQ